MTLPSSTAEAAILALPSLRGRVRGLMGIAGSAGRAIDSILDGFFHASIHGFSDSSFQAA